MRKTVHVGWKGSLLLMLAALAGWVALAVDVVRWAA